MYEWIGYLQREWRSARSEEEGAELWRHMGCENSVTWGEGSAYSSIR